MRDRRVGGRACNTEHGFLKSLALSLSSPRLVLRSTQKTLYKQGDISGGWAMLVIPRFTFERGSGNRSRWESLASWLQLVALTGIDTGMDFSYKIRTLFEYFSPISLLDRIMNYNKHADI